MVAMGEVGGGLGETGDQRSRSTLVTSTGGRMEGLDHYTLHLKRILHCVLTEI